MRTRTGRERQNVMPGPSENSIHRVATNRKATHDYFVETRIEAGIALQGTEVKAIRAGHISLVGAFARMDNGEAFVQNLTIQPYEFGNRFNHEPIRPRRLLLHRKELDRLTAATTQKGLTLVPLAVYFKRGKVKIELGVCRGKRQHDKRETLRRKTSERETQRAIPSATR